MNCYKVKAAFFFFKTTSPKHLHDIKATMKSLECMESAGLRRRNFRFHIVSFKPSLKSEVTARPCVPVPYIHIGSGTRV